MRKFFFLASSNAVNSGYDQGERCLSAVFFALLTCWHAKFSINLPSFFLHKLTSIYRQNWSWENPEITKQWQKVASSSSVVVNIASSVPKVRYSKLLHNKSRCLNTMKSFLTFNVINAWIFLYSQKVLAMKVGKTPSSRQRIFSVLYSPPSAVNITS